MCSAMRTWIACWTARSTLSRQPTTQGPNFQETRDPAGPSPKVSRIGRENDFRKTVTRRCCSSISCRAFLHTDFVEVIKNSAVAGVADGVTLDDDPPGGPQGDLQWRANRTSWCDFGQRNKWLDWDQTRPATLAPVPTTNNRLLSTRGGSVYRGPATLPADRWCS